MFKPLGLIWTILFGDLQSGVGGKDGCKVSRFAFLSPKQKSLIPITSLRRFYYRYNLHNLARLVSLGLLSGGGKPVVNALRV